MNVISKQLSSWTNREKRLAVSLIILLVSSMFLYGGYVAFGQSGMTTIGTNMVIPGYLNVGGNVNASSFTFSNGTTLGATGPQGIAGTNGTNGSNGVAGTNAVQPVNTYDYVLFVNSTATYMQNGITGQIIYNSTVASNVINSAIGNLTSGTIFLNSGIYSITNSINQKGGVSLYGSSSSILSLAANVPLIQSSSATDNLKMGLYNLYLLGNNRTQPLVYWDRSIQGKIEGCWLYDCASTYIYLAENGGQSYSNWIDHNEFSATYGGSTKSGNTSCSAINTGGDDFIFANQIDFGSEAGGLANGIIVNGAGCQIYGNHIIQPLVGIYCLSGATFINNNYLDSTVQQALVFGGSTYGSTITGNFILSPSYGSSTYDAIYFGSSIIGNYTITENIITGGSPQYGINVWANGGNMTIVLNKILNYANAGSVGGGINIYSGCTGNTISLNT